MDFEELMNEYLNIFGCQKICKWIYKYICTGEMAKIWIRIIFKGYFIWIFEYLNICAHHWSMPLGQSRQSGQSSRLGKYRQSGQYMHPGILYNDGNLGNYEYQGN